MSREDIVKLRGDSKASRNDRGGAGLFPSAVLGIVKNNIDPTRTGRVEVYLKRLNSPDQDNPANWTTVSYLSPFFGNTPNTSSSNDNGSYIGNPNSYGMWFTPPDIDTEVVCVFLNGDPSMGYYIGCVPQPGLTHMTPAIGSSSQVILNEGEAKSYGGATKLPVSEINNANIKQDGNPVLAYQPRPVHSYQAAILFKQGLTRDPDRGTIGSSSVRESPSRVFGISTPGRPIYQGGYDDTSIANAIKDTSIPDEKFKIIGRVGGHTIVMDDGDIVGKDQLFRMRTGTGHMIMMNDTAQTLFIIHANGQSYIELGKEGTIDMYSTNSVNIRTQGDLNLHADNNINIQAGKDFNLSANNVNIESLEATEQFVGTDFKQYTKGDFTSKVDKKMSMESDGDASYASSAGIAYINGDKVNLNTGSTPLKPAEVEQISVTAHTDTLYDSTKGYAPAPGKLSSIVSRAPAHTPWTGAGQGVDVKTDLSAGGNLPESPTADVTSINNAVPAAPDQVTTPAIAATAGQVIGESVSGSIDKTTTSSLVSQVMVNAATGSAKDAVANKVGIVEDFGVKFAALGSAALTPTQLAQAGYIKPGFDATINAAVNNGKSLSQVLAPNVWTGKDGINTASQYLNSTKAQVSSVVSVLQNSESQLKSVGMITGNESPTQTAGLILSTATSGLNATMAFAKSVGATGTGAFQSQALSLVSGTVAAVPQAIASGNYAASLAENSLNPLSGGVNVADKLKGIASGMFSKVTAAFKDMKAKVPQDLTKLAEEAAPASTIPKPTAEQMATLATASRLPGAQLASSLLQNIGSNPLNTTMGGMPGGTAAANNLVVAGADPTLTVPGLSSLASSVKSIGGAVSSGGNQLQSELDGLKNKIGAAGGLESLASTGLPTESVAQLNSTIKSLGSGGPVEIKLPTIAIGSFNLAGLTSKAKSLLGDAKIPGLPSGLPPIKIPSAEDAKKFDALKAEYESTKDQMYEAKKAYWDANGKYGPDDPKTISALSEYKTVMQKLEKLEGQNGADSTTQSA